MPLVEHESFCGKMCSSFCGVLIGLLLLPVGMWVVVWNEGNQVCTTAAYSEVKMMVRETGCRNDFMNNNKPIHLSCPVRTESAKVTERVTGIQVPNVLKIKTSVSMLQWKETMYSRSEKDAVGGGTTTYKCYCFSREWSTASVSINTNHLAYVCGMSPNDPRSYCPESAVPTFDELHNIPSGGLGASSTYAPSVYLGEIGRYPAFELSDSALSKTDLNPVRADSLGILSIPGWTLTSATDVLVYYKPYTAALPFGWSLSPSTGRVGDRQMRIEFYSASTISAIGRQLPRGHVATLSPISAGGGVFPPCDKRNIEAYTARSISAYEMLAAMQSDLDVLTTIMRMVTYFILFIGFALIGGPLSVAPDVVPCIGPYISGVAGCIVGIMAAFAALSLWALTTALAWLFYNPVYGILLLVVSAAATAAVISLSLKYKRNKGIDSEALV